MKRYLLLAAFVLLFVPSRSVRADLAAYLAKPEPVYKWEKRGEKKVEGGTAYDLHLVSQTWQDNVWEHHLVLFVPDNNKYPHLCTLMNTGGNGGDKDVVMMQAYLQADGWPVRGSIQHSHAAVVRRQNGRCAGCIYVAEVLGVGRRVLAPALPPWLRR